MTEEATSERHVPWLGIVICAVGFFVVVIVCGTYLIVHNHDLSEFRNLLTTLASLVTLGLSGAATILANTASKKAGTASEKAGQAAEQTNGGLDARIRDAVSVALTEHEETPRDG